MSIIIICNIDNKPMDFHYAFMDIKEFMDTRLETVYLFFYSFIHSTNICEWILINTTCQECMWFLVCLLNLLEMDI